MTQGHKTLATRLVDALIDAGTWVSREELQAAQQCSAVALDDALADLVMTQAVQWRADAGYRLAGTPLCRRAARLLRHEQRRCAVVGQPLDDGYHLGVAEQRAEIGLVMYELALPLPQPGQDALQHHLDQVGGVLAFVDSRGAG